MKWRQPAHHLDLSTSDQAMMEEVLELLAADSPNRDEATPASVSTTASITTDSKFGSSVFGHRRNSVTSHTFDEIDEVGDMQSSCDTRSSGEKGDFTGNTHVFDEEKIPTQTSVEQVQETDDLISRNSMHIPSMSSVRVSGVPRLPAQSMLPPPYHRSSWSLQLTNAQMFQLFGEDLESITSTISASTSTIKLRDFPIAIPLAPADVMARSPSSPYKKKSKVSPSSGKSKVSPTGERVHVMNSAEFDDLRRKLRMQTASRRYRKRKKEEARQEKAQVLELQAELTRLEDIKLQTQQYQQRSIESLKKELEMHEKEVTDLTEKVREAVKEEQEWIDAMNSSLRAHHRLTR
ncbi:hypothetical protein Plhal304r1_c102g0175291 [Plasmopara halstedii]